MNKYIRLSLLGVWGRERKGDQAFGWNFFKEEREQKGNV
jgi:hypothetical protein